VLDGPTTAEVVVAGAGIAGLTTAVLLARAGVDVAVVDAAPLGSGTTGGTTAKVTALQGRRCSSIRRDHGDATARAYVQANLAGLETVRLLAGELAPDCRLEVAAAHTCAIGDDAARQVEDELEACTAAGLPVERTATTDLPFPVSAAIRLDEQLQFDPVPYLYGLAAELRRRGGRLYEGVRATGLSWDGRRLESPVGEIGGGRVVLATGLPFADRGLWFARSVPRRSYAIAVRVVPGASLPEGTFLGLDEPTWSVRTMIDPADGERLLVVGGSGHVTGRADDTLERFRGLVDWAASRFECRDLRYHWSSQDHECADGLPVAGPLLPRSPWAGRTLVATGFAKWGMTNGTAAAIAIAGRILGDPPEWAGVFDSERINPAVSLPREGRANAEVVACLGRGWLGRLTGRGPDGGDAPVCTHLGGVLSWNEAERSWDCPLHGSRFATDGVVLDGPAVRQAGATDHRPG
jgi:glycine/D-amino acid oxidase-like deaminating enzyme